jgi:hypothetical protein
LTPQIRGKKFDKGNFEIIDLEKMTIRKAPYAPGWKWSIDVSPFSGTQFWKVEHLGMGLSGSATVAFENGEIYTLKKGDIFYVSPLPHDSWVVGDDEYVSLHFIGAEKYAD